MDKYESYSIAAAMKEKALVAVKGGPKSVEAYLYDAVQIVHEISFKCGGLDWQEKLLLHQDIVFPLRSGIEKHWRHQGKRVKAVCACNAITGELGVLVTEPKTGNQHMLYGRAQ